MTDPKKELRPISLTPALSKLAEDFIVSDFIKPAVEKVAGTFNWTFRRALLTGYVDFLSNRSQRVKLGIDCFSEWSKVPARVPQGTKLGPWLFLLMINDLSVSLDIFNLWKYVDDTTVSETVPKGKISHAQSAVDQVQSWSEENLFQLNCAKTKELLISFSPQYPQFPKTNVDRELIESVQCVKLLGLRSIQRKSHHRSWTSG